VTVRNSHNFRSDRWIGIKLLLEIPDALFHAVDVELILAEDEDWSHLAWVTVQNSHNFRSDCWIGIKLFLEFPDTLFHGVDEEVILGDDEVWSRQA